MARKIKKQEENIELEEKRPGKIQWFLFVFLIPLIFTILVTMIILSIYGVNVFEKAKELTNTVSSTVFKDDEREQGKSISDYQSQIVELEADIKNKEAEISSLESIVDSRDQTIQQIEAQKQQLQNELNQLRNTKTEAQKGRVDIIKTYETMSPKKSAPIISQMSDNDAVEILNGLKTDTLAKVLEKMTPEDAARLTKKLSSES